MGSPSLDHFGTSLGLPGYPHSSDGWSQRSGRFGRGRSVQRLGHLLLRGWLSVPGRLEPREVCRSRFEREVGTTERQANSPCSLVWSLQVQGTICSAFAGFSSCELSLGWSWNPLLGQWGQRAAHLLRRSLRCTRLLEDFPGIPRHRAERGG